MMTSCSWCHTLNDTGRFTFCETCGHRADLPRMECDCGQCQQPTRAWAFAGEPDDA